MPSPPEQPQNLNGRLAKTKTRQTQNMHLYISRLTHVGAYIYRERDLLIYAIVINRSTISQDSYINSLDLYAIVINI